MKDSLKSAPESFYEAFVYIVPAGYFWISVALISGETDPLSLTSLFDQTSIIVRIVIGIALTLFLLVTGQIFNTLCHWAEIFFWWIWIGGLEGNRNNKPWEERTSMWRLSKHRYPDESVHLSKVRAKWNMSLNMALLTLPLILYLLYENKRHPKRLLLLPSLLLLMIIGMLAAIDYFKRSNDERELIDMILTPLERHQYRQSSSSD